MRRTALSAAQSSCTCSRTISKPIPRETPAAARPAALSADPIEPFVLLLLSAFGVGALIGAVGVGGILLIPALAAFGGLGMREAMATALFTFIFTGVTGTLLYQRKRSIDWRITVPLC